MTLIVGVLPALRSTRTLETALGAGAHGAGGTLRRTRAHRWLLGAQVSLCVAVLIVAGLFIRTLRNLRELDPGFDRHTVVLLTLNDGAATTAIARRVAPALETIPGV